MLSGGKDDQNRSRAATRIKTSAAAQRMLGVLQEDLQVAEPTNVEYKG
jgi:hypothetical protein